MWARYELTFDAAAARQKSTGSVMGRDCGSEDRDNGLGSKVHLGNG
ncbi:hypothetical protein Vi05172_g2565 [Venturia inaequalis]|nr:hypothetical protein Vi05172_g2565 [Venturia inaequalis]